LKQEKVLVIRYRYLGDTILTVPFLHRLREYLPDADISVLTTVEGGSLLYNCPYIDRVLPYANEKQKNPFFQILKQIKREKFDRAFILKRSFSSAWLAFLAGIPQRIGFSTDGRGFLLTKRIHFDQCYPEVLNFLAHLPSPYNNPPPKTEKLFWATEAEKLKAQEVFRSIPAGKRIILHPGTTDTLKSWTNQNWALLLKELKGLDYQVILSGSKGDRSLCEEIQKQADTAADLDLSRTSHTLRENVACYQLCDAAICVDTGVMHLAAGVGIAVIGLFGPSDPRRWHPWTDRAQVLTSDIDLDCRPCRMKPTCTDRECLTELSVQQVLQAIDDNKQ